tara:strand:- start:287 stop:697 length:411 start_codon:yes stop_codon:yes gene_type:complete
MAAFSNYMEDAITAYINGTAFPTNAPANTFIQLYNGSPTDTGLEGTPLYGRTSYAAGGWTRGTAGAGTLSNTDIITITSSAASAATATDFAVFNASASGDLLFYGALGTSSAPVTKAIAVGDEIKFNALQLTLTVA